MPLPPPPRPNHHHTQYHSQPAAAARHIVPTDPTAPTVTAPTATVTIKTVQLRHRRATTPILCSYHIRFTCVVQLPPHSHHPNGPLFVPLQQAPAGDELLLLPPPPPPVGSGLEGQRNPLSLNKIPGSAFIAEVLQKVPSSPLCSMHPEDWGFCLTEPR